MKKYLIISAIALLAISCKNAQQEFLIKLIPVATDAGFGYIDKTGNFVINPQFSDATVFREGLALVESQGSESKWGYINEEGNYVIPAEYKSATPFFEGLAWVVKENEAPSAINTKGEVKFTLKEAKEVRYFNEGLAAFKMSSESGSNKWGFVNSIGKIVINPQFSKVQFFNGGLCAVANEDEKWGYIDKTGKLIINYQFDFAGYFIGNKAVVKLNDKAGVIDKSGRLIVNPQYDDLAIDGNVYLIKQNGKCGWCDKNEKIIINPQFDNAFGFYGKKVSSVISGDKYGYIDRKGKYVINPQFELAYPFNGSLALVSDNGKVGFIGKDGKYLITPQFKFHEVSQDYLTTYNLLIPIFVPENRQGSNDWMRYYQVSTDFFDISGIVNRMKKEITAGTVNGISINASPKEIIDKYAAKDEKDESCFYIQVFENEKISTEAKLSLAVASSYGKHNFNYNITLTDIDDDKGTLLLNELEKLLISEGYTKDDDRGVLWSMIFRNDKQVVKISDYSMGNILINVISLETEKHLQEMP